MRGSPRAERTCLDAGTLAAFAEGRVDEGAYGRIEEHLADCADCRVVLTRAVGADRSHGPLSSIPSGTELDGELLAPGVRVGRYVIQRLVGRGAMGTVYAANDPDLDRQVAVKLLRAGVLSDTARHRTRARLLREAQAMARLSHPEVITVYDVGAFGNELFVAMEYVEGETLRRWCVGQSRSCAEILAVYERAGRGLAAAHEAGLVHRDFKPDNVLVGRDGRVRVTDFGLARSVERHEGSSLPSSGAVAGSEPIVLTTTLTRAGTLIGTPAYMAPEQLRGGAADARSDVFSFCVALYEALYEERPFEGSTVLVLQAAIEQGRVRAPPLLTRVPMRTRTVLLRGLRAAPDERWESVRALLEALAVARAAPQRRQVLAGIAVAALGGLFAIVGPVAWSAATARSNDAPAVAPVAMQSAPPLAPTEPIDRPAGSALRWPEPIANIGAPAGSQQARSSSAASTGRAASMPSSRVPASLPRTRAVASASPNHAPQVGNNGALILE
jgi:serine/threonine protein kinase